MDPLPPSDSPDIWWNDTVLQEFECADSTLLGLAGELVPKDIENAEFTSDAALSDQDMNGPLLKPKSKNRSKHLKVPTKELGFKGKDKFRRQSTPSSAMELPLDILVEEMFAFPFPSSPSDSRAMSEPDSIASTDPTLAPDQSSSELEYPMSREVSFPSVRERKAYLQSIVSCLESGDVDMCSISEKRKVVEQLKERVKSIEGGVEALKLSLKRLIKYTI